MVVFNMKFDANVANEINRVQMKRVMLFFIIFCAIVILLGASLMIFSKGGGFALGLFLVVFGVLYIPLVKLLTKSAQKNLNKSMSILGEETFETFSFTEDKLKIVSQKGDKYYGETIADYDYLFKVFETSESYILYISKFQAHVVFKNTIVEGSIEELTSILMSKMPEKKYIRKF